MSGRRSARRGMTLIELVVVLAIIGIIAAVSAPAFASATRTSPEDAGALAMTRLLRRVQATALARAEPVTLTIDPATASYWLGDADSSKTLVMPDGVRLVIGSDGDSRRATLTFLPTGEVVGASLAVRSGDEVRSIRFDRWTGAVADAPQ